MKGESVHGALGLSRLVSSRLLLVILLAGLVVGSACSGAGLGITFQGWGGPTAVGNSIYVPTKRNSDQASLQIFDAMSGAMNNSFIVTGESTSIYGTPVQGPGLEGQTTFVSVIYTSDGEDFGRVYAVGPEGFDNPIWQFPEPGVDSVGVIFGGVAYSQTSNTVYFGSDDCLLYAIDATTGQPKDGTGAKRTGGPCAEPGSATSGVRYNADGPIWSTPVIKDGVVYFGTMEGTLYGISENGGSPILRFSADGAIAAAPIIEERVAYVGSFDKNFYAVPIDGGLDAKPKWTYSTNSWIWADALFASDARGQDMVFISSLDGSVQAINANSIGEAHILWSKPNIASEGIRGTPALVSKSGSGGQFSSLSDKVLVVGSRDGRVYGLDPQTGALAWDAPFNTRDLGDDGGQILAPVGHRGNTVYIVTNKYDIFAIDANTGEGLAGFPPAQ